MQNSIYTLYIKHLLDVSLAFFGIILLSPFLIGIAVTIKLSSKGDILFVQKRMGQNFTLFNLYKFRSMKDGNSGPLITSNDDNRITTIGKILRKYKLDELPQLFNVLKGDMSLVGPRPEVEKYVLLKKEQYRRVLQVKPGITDYAALKFVDEETLLSSTEDKEKMYIESILPQKIVFYMQYVHDVSFLVDIKLIFLTLIKIIR